MVDDFSITLLKMEMIEIGRWFTGRDFDSFNVLAVIERFSSRLGKYHCQKNIGRDEREWGKIDSIVF